MPPTVDSIGLGLRSDTDRQPYTIERQDRCRAPWPNEPNHCHSRPPSLVLKPPIDLLEGRGLPGEQRWGNDGRRRKSRRHESTHRALAWSFLTATQALLPEKSAPFPDPAVPPEFSLLQALPNDATSNPRWRWLGPR